MAATENQGLMVLKEEGAAAPAATPSSATPLAFFVILKPGQASEGGQDQGILVANQETNLATTTNQGLPGVGATPHTGGQASEACSDVQPENLPPESVCGGVKVTLDNNNMWNEFYRCKTEMILTKQGRRMFPYCRFRISGLEPFQRYILVMDITPLDNHRYKWNGRQWETNGKAEPHVLGRVFIHPESPSSGHYWTQNPVSFYKLKLTNNTLDQEGHVILHSMHRYLPRLHVVPADKATEVIQLNGPDVLTFTFPQTEFFAVTAYQNLRITQLKIDYNPFAKGFREDGPSARCKADPCDVSSEHNRSANEEEKPLKLSQLHAEDASAFAPFSTNKENFHSKGSDPALLENGVSTDKELSRRKRVRTSSSLEEAPGVKLKVKKGIPENRDKRGVMERASVNRVTVKEEEEEAEVSPGDMSSRGNEVDGSAGLTELHAGTEDRRSPVVLSSDLSCDTSGQESVLDRTVPAPGLSSCTAGSEQESVSSHRPLQKDPPPLKQPEAIPLPQLAQFLKQRNIKPRPARPADASLFSATPASPPSSCGSPRVMSAPEMPSFVSEPSLPLPEGSEVPGDPEQSDSQVKSETAPSLASEVSSGIQATAPSTLAKKKRKSTARCRKHGRFVKRSEVLAGPPDISMQPNLEDVEGLLFVSFTSKEALENHLGDQPCNTEAPSQPQEAVEPPPEIEAEIEQEKIARLEQVLLQDLRRFKHRQVIHPVLQEVGLKLTLLDPTLAIDLQYLGVRLPLPPPFVAHHDDDGGSGMPTSSPDGMFPFVSRTGKTTDFTKIKGWRDKFNITPDASSSKMEGGAGSDAALKNRSAFCSDMLDEYLASEGKLIDERAASFSQSTVSPVVYQLPTKSMSYVRTLDSVLKKQPPAPPVLSFPFKPLAPCKKPKVLSKPKPPAKPKNLPGQGKAKLQHPPKLPSKSKVGGKTARAPGGPPHSGSPRPGDLAARPKALPGALPVKVDVWHDSNLVTQGASGMAGRTPGLSKTLLKLMELEDGAVWEGRRRTCVTDERASVALGALLTAQGSLKGSKGTSKVMKRRAPPCLNDFCRLGCVCVSLGQERRRFTHCGKPECMFGCTCLKRRVLLVKVPHKKRNSHGDLELSDMLAEDPQAKPKKKKRRLSYTIEQEPEQESEPAARVQTLWNRKESETDPEPLFSPTPVYLPWPQPLICQEPPNFTHSMREEDKGPVYRYFESMMTCARVRPFSCKTTGPSLIHSGNLKDAERIPVLNQKPEKAKKKAGKSLQNGSWSEPIRRLEIVSECTWEKKADQNHVLRVVCERMAQNHLSQPFHVGRYLVKPVSQTHQKEGRDRFITYKVLVSQSPLPEVGVKLEEEEWHAGLNNLTEAKLAKKAMDNGQPPASNKRRALPFFTRVFPAGLLTANKKQPGIPAQGLIKVNGKSYPHAKLQLGRMGALHPANRLAAYITGRLHTVSQKASSAASNAAKSPRCRPPSGFLVTGSMDVGSAVQSAGPGDKTTTTTTTSPTTTITTTTSKSSSPMIATVLKNLVTTPTVGKVYTKFVVNSISSLQQKLPVVRGAQLVGGIHNVPLPPAPLLVVGPGLSSQVPQADPGVRTRTAASPVISPVKVPQGHDSVPQLVAPSTSNAGPVGTCSMAAVVKETAANPQGPPVTLLSVSPGLRRDGSTQPKATVPKSPGSATPGPRVLLIPVSQSSPAVRPVAPAAPSQTQGQRMVLQPIRSTAGTTLYRHPNGQLVQLVPLSQLRTIQSNLVIRSPGTVVRLPTPSSQKSPVAVASSVSKATTGSSSTTQTNASPGDGTVANSAATPVASPTKLPESPVCCSAVTTTTTTTTTSPVSACKLASLSGATAFTLSSLPSSIKSVPGFLGQTGTYTLRIAPSTKETKVITLNPTGTLPGSSEVLSVPSGFTLLQIPKSTVPAKPLLSHVLVTPTKLELLPKVSPKKDSETSSSSTDAQASQMPTDKDPSQEGKEAGVCSDHSYINGQEHSEDGEKAGGAENSCPASLEQESQSTVGSPGNADVKPGPNDAAVTSSLPTSPAVANTGLSPPSLTLAKASDADSVASESKCLADKACDSAAVTPSAEKASKGPENEQDVTPQPAEEEKDEKHLEEGEVEVEVDLGVTGGPEDMTEEDSEEDSEDDSTTLVIDQEDSEEEVAVDIETVEELTEKINIARMRAAAMQMKLDKVRLLHEEKRTRARKQSEKCQQKRQALLKKLPEKPWEETPGVAGRIQHNVTERRRRDELRVRFEILRRTLDLTHLPKASKFFILEQANSEIQALEEQNDHLEEMKKMLSRQRATYLKKVSHISGKTEEMIMEKLQDICAKQKSLEAQKKRKSNVGVEPLSSRPQVPVGESLSDAGSLTRRPNILSRKKPCASSSKVLPSTLVNDGPSQNGTDATETNPAFVPIKGSVQQPDKVTGSGTVLSPVPGVASVTINVPGMSLPIQVKSPLPEVPLPLSSQAPDTSPVKNSPEAKRCITMPKVVTAEPLIPSETSQSLTVRCAGEVARESQEAQELEDGEVVGDQLACNGQEDLREALLPWINGVNPAAGQEEDDDEDDDDDDDDEEEDPEDETLMSLLNEIAFLNQQMNSDDSASEMGQASFSQCQVQKGRRSTLLRENTADPGQVDKDKGHEGDDERSLSPLFLQLDEDLLGSTEATTEESKVQAGRTDSVEPVHRPGNHLKLETCNDAVANGVTSKSLSSCAKGGALTPPPLLQMKTGSIAVSTDSRTKSDENDSEVSWRPMPRLAPLGRRTSNPLQDIAARVTKGPEDLPSQCQDGATKTT